MKKILKTLLLIIITGIIAIFLYQNLGIKQCDYCGEYFDSKKNIILTYKKKLSFDNRDNNMCDMCAGYEECASNIKETGLPN